MLKKRLGAVVLALVIATDLVAVAFAVGIVNIDPSSALAAARSQAKVAIVVGPVGSLTDDYRTLAAEAAREAREITDDVVTVYSPDATWPAVRAALQGASIVVYLGHGNGWPSPYRDAPFDGTQNGLGLNPVAGVDDDAHQYFGERYLARSVELAPGAIVILSHLCYASGNPEPGGPEPTLEVATERVDNYAAGWMAAGAAAVIAEGHGRPAGYVKGLLRGRQTVEELWRDAPTFQDNVVAANSARTAGATLLLDPDHRDAGFFRSLAVIPSARTETALRTTAGVDGHTDGGRTATPSLADRGAHFGTPVILGAPVAASERSIAIPIGTDTLDLIPGSLILGARWNRIAAPADPLASPDVPPAIDLIVPERPDAAVTTHAAIRSQAGLSALLTMPPEPGLYRLVTTIHDADGVAYDADTQGLLGALIVHVAGSLWASYGVPDQVDAAPGQPLDVDVRLANTGTVPWVATPPADGSAVDPDARTPLLVVRWIALDDISTFGDVAGPTAVVAAAVAPGDTALLTVSLQAPPVPGRYLLVFDMQDDQGVSLAGRGVPTATTRVVVQEAPLDGPPAQP